MLDINCLSVEEEEAVGFCGDGVVQGYEQCDCGLDYWSI